MTKSKSSKRWLQEHCSDAYVKKAKEEGQRARSFYKLQEIQKQYKFIRSGMKVVDLGAAPGSWSEFVVSIVGPEGIVVAIDILPMQPIVGVKFLQGDFTDEKIRTELKKEFVDYDKIDLVISDMAPNLTGIAIADQARAQELADAALSFAKDILRVKGFFLIKLFQGTDFNSFIKKVRLHFKTVRLIKPDASRARSKEIFLLANERVMV